MPITIDGRDLNFNSAVRYVQKYKPGISNPKGYVASIEKRQKGAKELSKKIERLQKKKQPDGTPYDYARDSTGKSNEY